MLISMCLGCLFIKSCSVYYRTTHRELLKRSNFMLELCKKRRGVLVIVFSQRETNYTKCNAFQITEGGGSNMKLFSTMINMYISTVHTGVVVKKMYLNFSRAIQSKLIPISIKRQKKSRKILLK